MKRFVAFALVGAFPLVASAGNPVSVNPPAQPSSMNQPLSAAVQAAGATLPPAPVMTSQPTNWGGGGCPSVGVPCADSACGQTRPYFNMLAPRGDCGGRGTCLDRLKEWVTYHPEPCNLGLHPTPYMAPLRTYFTCRPGDGSPGVGCGGAGCGAGCASGRGAGRGGCGAVEMPVKRLTADGCDAPACRPRVRYAPMTDCGGTRPRLLDRLFGWFSPKGDAAWGDDWCAPVPYPYPAAELLPANAAPSGPPAPMAPPTTSTLPLTTVPASTPAGRPAGKTIQLSPQQPFTNP